MSTVRLRRLRADYENLKEYVRRHPRLRLIQAEGDPPERYQIEYRVRSMRLVNGELQTAPSHLVEIALTQSYPRTPPQCRMLSPVFHPNIAPHAICVGDHWGAGESLQSIVARIGEMLAYQSYNVKSPLNGEAARWVDGNKDKLPLDRVSMLVEDDGQSSTQSTTTFAMGATVVGSVPGAPQTADASGAPAPTPWTPQAAPAPAAAVPQPPAETVGVLCEHCQAPYRIPADFIGRKVRCRKCMQVFIAAAAGA